MDIVRQFENIAISKGFKFHYGNKSHLNLIDQNGNLEPNKTHLLLFPVTRGKLDYNDNKRNYKGRFFFVRPDNFSQDYYNNTNSAESEDKFTTKIEPLIQELNGFERSLNWCDGFDILSFESIEIVDALDSNFTGFWVNFNIDRYE